MPVRPYFRRTSTGTSGRSVKMGLPRSLVSVMRLLGILAIVAPVMIGILLLYDPNVTASWVVEGYRATVAGIMAITLGVASTAVLSWLMMRIRFGRLVKAAEKIAAGDYTVAVPTQRGGLEARLGAAINVISTSLADTHDRATIDRLTGVANRQALLAYLFAEVERATRYGRPLCVAFVDIDHFKAVNDSYGHAAGDIVLRDVAQTLTENLRASDLIGRYGGEEFMLILTETDVEEAATLSEKLRELIERKRFSIEGNAALSVTISIGIAGGIGPADPDGDARPRRRRGDVLGQVARPQPDLHLRGARRGRPRPPSAHLRRRPGARPGDRPPGTRRRDRRADLVHRPTSPLPRAALGAHRRDRRRDVSSARTPRRRGRPDPRRGTAPRRRQGRGARSDPRQAGTRSRRPNGGPSSSTRASGRSSSSTRPRYGTPCRSSSTTTSGSPATATRTGCAANEIPLGARIVAIADAYDAMTHDRPYKRAMSHDAAIVELKPHAGTQFDPELVALFCDLYADHAPTPDPTILAITDPQPSPVVRRERRTRAAEGSSMTMAGEGHGLVDLGGTDPPSTGTRKGDGPRPDKHGIAAS